MPKELLSREKSYSHHLGAVPLCGEGGFPYRGKVRGHCWVLGDLQVHTGSSIAVPGLSV